MATKLIREHGEMGFLEQVNAHLNAGWTAIGGMTTGSQTGDYYLLMYKAPAKAIEAKKRAAPKR